MGGGEAEYKKLGRQSVLGRLTAHIRGNLQEMPHAGLGWASCNILHHALSSRAAALRKLVLSFPAPSTCLAIPLQR